MCSMQISGGLDHFEHIGFLYFVSATLNIWILQYFEYSVVLPLTSLICVWTMILSYIILKEKITA